MDSKQWGNALQLSKPEALNPVIFSLKLNWLLYAASISNVGGPRHQKRNTDKAFEANVMPGPSNAVTDWMPSDGLCERPG
jgi:hypothetical protein